MHSVSPSFPFIKQNPLRRLWLVWSFNRKKHLAIVPSSGSELRTMKPEANFLTAQLCHKFKSYCGYCVAKPSEVFVYSLSTS